MSVLTLLTKPGNKIQFSSWIMITIKGHKSGGTENLGNSNHKQHSKCLPYDTSCCFRILR